MDEYQLVEPGPCPSEPSMQWLFQRYLERQSVASIVYGFEEFFASRGLSPPRQPTAPPAVVFVDLSGYTRLTEEHGDEVAIGFTSTLQREAEAAAAANDGRLVKLSGRWGHDAVP